MEAALVFNGILAYLWGDHLLNAFRLWRREREARAFRNLLIAWILETSIVSILLRTLLRLLGVSESLTLVMLGVTWVLLLIGGIVVWRTWRSGDRSVP